MVVHAALIACLGPAAAQEPLPPPPITTAQEYRLSADDERAFRSGSRMARIGQGVFTIGSVISLVGVVTYYVSPVGHEFKDYGGWTMLAGTGVGLVAVPFAVVGSQRATGAVARGGRSVRRSSGHWSIVCLGLSAASLGGAAYFYDPAEPLVGELGLYLGWSLASASFEMAMHQLSQAEWAHNRPIIWGVAPTGNGLAVSVRF